MPDLNVFCVGPVTFLHGKMRVPQLLKFTSLGELGGKSQKGFKFGLQTF